MAWYRAGGGGIPSSLKTGMNSVLNKKFGTATTYDPAGWPDDVNLLGKLPEKTASGALVNISDGADDVPIKALSCSIVPQGGNGTPSSPVPITGTSKITLTHSKKNLLPNDLTTQTVNGTTFTVNADKSITISGIPSATTRVYITKEEINIKTGSFFSFGTMPTGTRVFCVKKASGSTTYPTISPQATATIDAVYTDFLIEVATSFDGTAFTIYPMCEIGSSASAFEAYDADTYEIDIPPLGKNQWNEKWEVGSISTSTGENTVDNNVLRSKDYIPVTPNATMTWSCGSNASAIYSFFGYDSNKTFVGTISNTKPFTIPSNVYFIRFRLYAVYGTTYLNDIQIEVGSTATSYEPYQYMFSGQVNALTGEVETGYALYKVTSFTGLWNVSNPNGTAVYATIPTAKHVIEADDNMRSNIMTFSTNPRATLPLYSYNAYDGTSTTYTFCLPSSVTSLAEANQWLENQTDGLYIIIKLATPISIDMDSVDWQTQLGVNNFYNDCGDTSVTYRQDIDLALGGN